MAKKFNPAKPLVKNGNPEFGGYDCPSGTTIHRDDARAFVPNILPPPVSYDTETVFHVCRSSPPVATRLLAIKRLPCESL